MFSLEDRDKNLFNILIIEDVKGLKMDKSDFLFNKKLIGFRCLDGVMN